jgi:lipoyl(octanoyl) transferase
MTPLRELAVVELGRMDYAAALALQEEAHAQRRRGEIPDTLFLVEHSPVITLGRGAKQEHVLVTRERLQELGIDLFEIGRGGDVTYHGPGQLVGYPILDLRPDRCDVRRYVRNLEQVMIELAGSFGISGQRIEGKTGAFCEDRKFGALGVRISHWVTLHGFAVNVSTDLDAFSLIVPCGLRDTAVTSLSLESGRDLTLEQANESARECFAHVFGYSLRPPAGA